MRKSSHKYANLDHRAMDLEGIRRGYWCVDVERHYNTANIIKTPSGAWKIANVQFAEHRYRLSALQDKECQSESAVCLMSG